MRKIIVQKEYLFERNCLAALLMQHLKVMDCGFLNCFFSARKIQRITLQFYSLKFTKQKFKKNNFSTITLRLFFSFFEPRKKLIPVNAFPSAVNTAN